MHLKQHNNQIYFYDAKTLIVGFSINHTEKQISDLTRPYSVPESLLSQGVNFSQIIEIIREKFPDYRIKIRLPQYSLSDNFNPSFKKDLTVSMVLEINNSLPINSALAEIVPDKKRRNLVKHALSIDFKTAKVKDAKVFYSLYLMHCKRHNLTPKALDYFCHLVSEPNVHCLATYLSEKLCGLQIFILKQKSKIIMLQYNFSDSNYWPLHINEYLYFNLISYAHKMKIKILDFGPTLPYDHSQMHFKESFGAAPVANYYYHFNPQFKDKVASYLSDLTKIAIKAKYSLAL